MATAIPNPIARKKLTPKPAIERSDATFKLAGEAMEVLGYRPLKQAVITSTPLRNLLARLEIEVLDTDQVLHYKKRAMQEHGNNYNWQKEAIATYDKPIPEFVLRKAIAIKKELNYVDIYVESLRYYPDPFLVVSSAGRYDDAQRLYSTEAESYYIEVWDEPKFEASL